MYQGKPTWVVSRYEDIRAALVDPRLSAETIPASMMPKDSDNNTPVMFARVDDPEHHRIRRMLTRDFTFRRVDAYAAADPGDRRFAISTRCSDSGPPADLVRAFALPVPSLVIAHLLGVPDDDLEMFHHHTTVGLDGRTTDEEKTQAFGAMFAYIAELVERKEHEPGDDLLSRLVADHVVTGDINRETATVTGAIMMQAGHETTANMIALGTVALMEHRDDVRATRTHRRPVRHRQHRRRADALPRHRSQPGRPGRHEDLILGGQQIRAGDWLVMNLPAGNWDPDFVDNPDVLDGDRNARGHLGFGYGVHQCIGANLARVEMQIAFATLARRVPGLQLAVDVEDLRFKGESGIYGMKELPVTW